MKTAIATAFLLVLPPLATADVLYEDAITFGPAYAVGPPTGFPMISADYGTPLTILGVVTAVGVPFSALLPSSPYELTMVYENGTCAERGNFDGPCTGGDYCAFTGGTLSIYLDATPDAAFTAPETFRDGEIVLVAAQQWSLHAAYDDPQEACPWYEEDHPDLAGGFRFSGGTWFSAVTSRGEGLLANFEGETYRYDIVPPALESMGYVVRMDGHIDIVAPVATKPTSWGRVKALYR